MTIEADVLVVGSGTMANLMAMFFADAAKRVCVSGYAPYPQALQNGMGLESAIAGRRPIKVEACNLFVSPFENDFRKGQVGVLVRTRRGASPYLSDLRLRNDKLVVFATKTFSNPQVIEDLKPVLDRNTGLTFFTTQNGVHPEIEIKELLESAGMRHSHLFRGIAQGGAFPIRRGIWRNTIQCYSLGYWGKDDNDRTFVEGLEEIKKYFCDETIPGEICFGDNYRINSVHKAIANTLNSTCFLFGARIEEILDNEPLRKFTEEKNYEAIRIAKEDMGLDVNVAETKENSFQMYEALRPHYPSMAVDAFRSFFNPLRKLDTEIKHMDAQFVEDCTTRSAFLNGLCVQLVEDFTRAFNEVRKRSLRLAVIFGLRFITRNRVAAGLPPYRFFEVPLPRMVERQAWILPYEEDARVGTGPTYLEIFSQIAKHYNMLKAQYADCLTEPEFRFTVPVL
jgi:ketopantoate reductase